ncbi:hypothetical protein P7C70_g4731, partial [Phenoliferia sp. Uapishka_3]
MPATEVKPTRAEMRAALMANNIGLGLRGLQAESVSDDKPFDRKPADNKPAKLGCKQRSRSFSVIVVERRFRRRAPSPVVKAEEVAEKLLLLAKQEPPAPLLPQLPAPAPPVVIEDQEVPVLLAGPELVPARIYIFDPDEQWPAQRIVKERSAHFEVKFGPTYSTPEEVSYWEKSVLSKVLQPDGRYYVHWRVGAVTKKNAGELLREEWKDRKL